MQHLDLNPEAQDKSIRPLLSKTRFVDKYGDESIPVSTIPYASSFGVDVAAMSLREVADMEGVTSGLAVKEDNTASLKVEVDVEGGSGESEAVRSPVEEGRAPPLYAFSTALPGWRGRVEAELGLPDLLEVGVTSTAAISAAAAAAAVTTTAMAFVVWLFCPSVCVHSTII